MEFFIFVQGIFEKGDLVFQVRLFEEPLIVVANELVFLGVFNEKFFNFFRKVFVGFLKQINLLAFLFMLGLELLQIAGQLSVGLADFSIFGL